MNDFPSAGTGEKRGKVEGKGRTGPRGVRVGPAKGEKGKNWRRRGEGRTLSFFAGEGGESRDRTSSFFLKGGGGIHQRGGGEKYSSNHSPLSHN